MGTGVYLDDVSFLAMAWPRRSGGGAAPSMHRGARKRQ